MDILAAALTRPTLDPWLLERLPEARGPLAYRLIAGGRSNLTFEVSDSEGRHWALRRQPLGTLLPTAHDMGREHRILTALSAASAVPVPRPLALCEDPAVTGASFYVMTFAEGSVLKYPEQVAGWSPQRCRLVADNLVDVLLELHATDIDRVGLGGLARTREDYLARQLARWNRQFEASARPGGVASMSEAYRRLAAAPPKQQAATVVHADYRLDNVVIAADGSVAAVLDWELATLGDPLADLGALLAYWAADDGSSWSASATVAPGFPSRAEVAARYGAGSDLDLTALAYYQAFATWRLGCILEGVIRRYDSGGGGGDTEGIELYREGVTTLGNTALELLAAL